MEVTTSRDGAGQSPAALSRPPLVQLGALLLALVAALYASAAGRGFTSEDFLLVRYLGEHPPWEDLRGQLTEPWLGIWGIRFLRPISTLLFGLEIAAFGPRPLGYVLVHLLVHGLVVLLVWSVARELARPLGRSPTGEAAAWLGAALFAVYPLHPNAVVFVASFATLAGGALSLVAIAAYQRFRAHGDRRWWLAGLAAFGLALGSYEASTVVLVWIAAYDHLIVAARGRSHRELLVGWLPWAALLAGYFGWRHLVFGELIGGYADTRARLVAPASLVRDLAVSVYRLHLPLFEWNPAAAICGLAAAVLILAPLALFAMGGAHRAAARPWAFGWVVAISSMLPFAFQPVVPANGRYWYTAAAGASVSLAFLAAAVVAAAGARARLVRLVWLGLAAYGVFWGWRLVANVRDCRRAADLAHSIQAELVRLRGTGPSSPRLFVTGYPYFLVNRQGVNLAQVYHYGLRDAARPPFSTVAVPVLPLPPLSDAELLPVTLAAPGRVLVWDAGAERLRPARVSTGGIAVELGVVPTAPGANPGGRGPASVEVRLPPGSWTSFRLLLSAPINGTVVDLGAGDRGGGTLHVELPLEFLRTSRHLYGGPVFWWLEARDGAGRLTGFTRMRRVEGLEELDVR